MLSGCLSSETKERLDAVEFAGKIGKKQVPTDLNGLSYAQLAEIQNHVKRNDVFGMLGVVTGLGERELLAADAVEVSGCLNMMRGELKRIGELFASVELEPTADETAAGIGALRFGAFGTIDWFARRMGITEHDEAADRPWQVYYKVMQIDNATEQYKRRLQRVMENKPRTHKR